MKIPDQANPLILFAVLIITVLSFSFLTNRMWGNPPEKRIEANQLVINPDMTVVEYGKINAVPLPVLLKIFNLHHVDDSSKLLSDFQINSDQIKKVTQVEMTQYLEDHSKNPVRFTIHFMVFIVFMTYIFFLFHQTKITPRIRNWLYLIAITIFGLGFNSNPSPMGPLRDTIALLSEPYHMIHPRLFAILTFLVFVVIANKFICSWVCQLGVLQDLIFRINQSQPGKKVFLKQRKMPFYISNTVRISFFIVISVSSLFWTYNVLEKIDPFNVFNPEALILSSWLFIVMLLTLSLFIYRPWCHLFCPFGLVSWIFEKISIYKIKVDYQACTTCKACTNACPSPVMEAILVGDKTIPDCFACGSCINVCPTKAIKFDKGHRTEPPVDFLTS